MLKQTFGGVLIANEQFTKESATQIIQEGVADAIAFGRAFIANPDLVKRFRRNADLNEPDPMTFYGGGAEGYADYSKLK